MLDIATSIKNILFDFDGVILDSMPIRDLGFREIFRKYEERQVNQLLDFHRENGGLSRYVKIRYFYEKILNKNISDDEINAYADTFSKLMRQELINSKYLVEDTMQFIKSNYKDFEMHIVSGSDEEELKFLCDRLGVLKYFISISGSPRPKKKLVEMLLKDYKYNTSETILIGDSVNDYEASMENCIAFYGYNNEDLKQISQNYISDFDNFQTLRNI